MIKDIIIYESVLTKVSGCGIIDANLSDPIVILDDIDAFLIEACMREK
jgi:hypothetical protein